MAKYQLVASHYNSYTGKYENEQIITMSDYDLNSLIGIDQFTCLYTKAELISMIKKENNIFDNINTLSIRYYKNLNSYPSYFQIITDNEIIESVSNDIEQKQIYGFKNRFANVINKNNEMLRAETKKLIELIESRDLEQLDKLIHKSSDLKHLINRYLNSVYDNEAAREKDLAIIALEFSRYKTFRGWIVASTKKYEKKYTKTTYQKPVVTSKEKIEVKSIEQHEAEYENKFKCENNRSYQEQMAMNYNIRDIDKDIEEFIEPDELEQMGYTK